MSFEPQPSSHHLKKCCFRYTFKKRNFKNDLIEDVSKSFIQKQNISAIYTTRKFKWNLKQKEGLSYDHSRVLICPIRKIM